MAKPASAASNAPLASAAERNLAHLTERVRKFQGGDLFDLSSKNIDDACLSSLIRSLKSNRAVRRLKLKDNQIKNAGAAALASWLGSPSCCLVSLDLSGTVPTKFDLPVALI
jgi:hypothetical protein